MRQFHAIAIIFLLGSSSGTHAEDAKFPPELVKFPPLPDGPFFKGAGEGKWDAAIRERGWVMREGDQWKLWYTGYDGTRSATMHLGYATSADGINWKR